MRAIRIVAILAVCVIAGLWAARAYRDTPVPAVDRLAEFSLPDLDGRHRSISEWSGKSLVINFWATWCGPCRREMPLLQALHREHGDAGVQVIGVALDNLPDVRRFVDGIGVTYPILYGEHEASLIAESFGEAYVGLPFSVVVSSAGEILDLRSGELHADYLRQLVAELDAVAGGQSSVADARTRLSAQ